MRLLKLYLAARTFWIVRDKLKFPFDIIASQQ
jgi:hypothetical protein